MLVHVEQDASVPYAMIVSIQSMDINECMMYISMVTEVAEKIGKIKYCSVPPKETFKYVAPNHQKAKVGIKFNSDKEMREFIQATEKIFG